MKKTIGLIIFIALACFFACNKDTDDVSSNNFTQASAEEWFNTTFKNSKEWQQNPDSQNKIPDWSNGMYQKKDSLEIFEFPLLENKATITVPQDKSITDSDTKKILDATLLRMAIIKTSTNEIIVRKLYYVPEYKYLLAKGYDISDVMLNKTNDDFTGLLITKNWNDALLSYHKVKNGKIEEILVKYDVNDSKGNSLNSIKMNNYATAKASGLGDEQNLDEVVINNNYHAPVTYVYLPSQPYYPTTSPSYNPYGTSGGGGGGTGGVSNNSTTVNISTFNITNKITNLIKELKCFNKNEGAKLTIYADQSITGSRDLTANIGHTFIGITQNGVTRSLGFYPDSPNASLLSNQTSEIHDNSTSVYDVSITINISAVQLVNVINYIIDYPTTYDLNNFNCTDFGIKVMNLGGLSLPKTIGNWGILFKGHNPSDLAEDMRTLALPQGATRNLNTGKAPAKSGTCN